MDHYRWWLCFYAVRFSAPIFRFTVRRNWFEVAIWGHGVGAASPFLIGWRP